VQVKAAKSAGCRLQCLRPVPGSAVPKTKNRRDGAPDGVAVASGSRHIEDHAAETKFKVRLSALRHPSPLQGVKAENTTRRNRVRESRGVGDEQGLAPAV
jgi:hypothetical protein